MQLKNITLKSINKFLICFGILLLPLFGFKEYLFTLGLYTPDYSNPLTAMAFTGPYIKGIKDLLLLILCINFLIYICIGTKNRSIKFPNTITMLFFFYIIVQAGAMLAKTNLLITLISIRPFLPLLLVILSYYFIEKEDIQSIRKAVIVMVCVEAFLGAIQFVFGRHHYGASPLGFGARVSGTFFICQSMGMFMLLGNIFLLAEDLKTTKQKRMFAVFSFFILLTGSATSMIGLLVAIIVKNYYKTRRFLGRDVIIAAILILLPLFAVMLPALSGRGEDIYSRSGYTRLKIFTGLFDAPNTFPDILVGHGIGYGSNFTILASLSGQLKSNSVVKAFGTDSFFTSFISQIGIVGLLLFLYVNFSAWKRSFSTKFMLGTIMIPVLLVTGVSAIFTEYFPINWIYPVILGYVFKQYNYISRQEPVIK